VELYNLLFNRQGTNDAITLMYGRETNYDRETTACSFVSPNLNLIEPNYATVSDNLIIIDDGSMSDDSMSLVSNNDSESSSIDLNDCLEGFKTLKLEYAE
jgi:hypothetical protein